MSRAELTVRTGLNRSTVRALATELADLGLVREWTPAGSGAAGRPSIMVAPSEDVFVLAVDIGVDHLRAARDRARRRGARPGRRRRRAHRVRRRADRRARSRAHAPGSCWPGAPPARAASASGSRCAAWWRPTSGVVRFAPNLGWIDVPLGALLDAELGGIPAAGRQRGRPRRDGRARPRRRRRHVRPGLPLRRGRDRRRHHRRRSPARRCRRVRRRDRAHDRQPAAACCAGAAGAAAGRPRSARTRCCGRPASSRARRWRRVLAAYAAGDRRVVSGMQTDRPLARRRRGRPGQHLQPAAGDLRRDHPAPVQDDRD